MNNHYDVLGVPKEADAAAIKQAYRKLAKRYHPDTNGGSLDAERKFKEIQKAYETLGDPDKRSSYDESLSGRGHAGGAKGSAAGMGANAGKKSAGGAAGMAGMASGGGDGTPLSKQFEQFFGFKPQGKEGMTQKPGGKPSNPLDTTDLFNRFFGKN
ncbi:J domain-containing protein [Paenibacillus algorifonticola]|uniref:J domain-containing protein n=1 Tax=Paenibacillus algorifonticola TaxID=684063 RepID=UPI003D2ABFC8